MKKLGRKSKEWESCKRQIKPKFAAAGITSCEACGSDYNLQWAHARKRRHLLPGELKVVALICGRCHAAIESQSHEAMHAFVMLRIIKARKVQPVDIPDSAWTFKGSD